MNKTEQLEILFEKWKNDQKNEPEDSCERTMIARERRFSESGVEIITKDKFCNDGIIDESLYNNQVIKVLFISNEANDVNTENAKSERIQYFIDYYDKKFDDGKGKFRERICCLYQVVLDSYTNTPPVIEREPVPDLARDFAFMNLNKRGGAEEVYDDHIKQYCEYEEYRENIKKEIEIIDPDLIVWLGCNTFDAGVPQILGMEKNRLMINDRAIPVIRMWHPSYYRAKRRFGEERLFKDQITARHAGKLKGELTEQVMNLIKAEQSKRK